MARSKSAGEAVNWVNIDRTRVGGPCAAEGGVPAKTIAAFVTKACVPVQEGCENKEARGIKETLLTPPTQRSFFS